MVHTMNDNLKQKRLDCPALYQIRVRGRLDAGWSDWFDGMAIASSQDQDGMTITTITGLVVDQVALHGLLARIRDLGLTLLNVERLAEGK